MNEKLNQYHLCLLIYMIQSGLAILTLPRIVAESFGTNGWIVIIVCSLAASAHIWLISLVYRQSGGRSVFDILEQSIHKAVLFPIYAVLAILWILIGCLVLKQYILILQMSTYQTANPMVFKLVCDVLIFLMLLKGIYNITKVATVFYYLSFWILFLSFLLMDDFRWERVTPFLFAEGNPSLMDWLEVYIAFLGYELALFLFPYVSRKTKFTRAVLIGNGIVTVVYLVTVILAYGFFSFEQLRHLVYPVMDMLAYVELPFVERIENLLFSLFLYKIFITTALYCWVAVETLERMFQKVRRNMLSFVVMIAGYMISFIPKVTSEIRQWLLVLSSAQVGATVMLTLILLGLVYFQIRRNRRKQSNA